MASKFVTCCRALTGLPSASPRPAAVSCRQLPQIAGLVQSWIASNESMLKQILSLNLTKSYGVRIIADEWTPKPGLNHLGRGDLVAELPCGTHLVIELKYLKTSKQGHTARVMRNRQRRELEQQTYMYGKLWQERLRDQGDFRPVICASFTNEDGLKHYGTPDAHMLSVFKAVDGPELQTAAAVAATKSDKKGINSNRLEHSVMHAH